MTESALSSKAQATGATFELHTLGWEAFQNLCGCVLREILGQTYTIFSSTNDAGQDGAFQGKWTRKNQEAYTGRFVVQCKFTCQRDSHLSLSDLDDELEKAKRLAAAGNAQTYLLMTNAKVSGASDVKIREAFNAILEVDSFDILGEEWLTEQIRESRRLRSLVPRIYGLGDLSQILDERVYRQANELLLSWKDNLAKFVPTEAHRKSVEALQSKRFVMLLGDPMAGKSTISAALALAAADSWECSPVFATSAEDFKRHWNPDEPNQFFWIDDAFGQTQYNGASAQKWNSVFPFLSTAITSGARVVFTSRTNIYNEAKRHLKLSSFPLLTDSQVLVEVEKLGLREKKRILYNHLRMGDQPVEFRAKIKPYLEGLAERPKLLPEIARRLGNPFFTKELYLAESTLSKFVDEPTGFLVDVIQESSKSDFAALCLLFMRAGQVCHPLSLDDKERVALAVIEESASKLRDSFLALEDVMVKKSFGALGASWKFAHPTIREAMAVIISHENDLLDIYLAGAKPSEVVNECACSSSLTSGAKIFVPHSRYPYVLEKLEGVKLDDYWERYQMCRFISKRSTNAFLRLWVEGSKTSYLKLIKHFRHPASSGDFCAVLSRLKEAGLLDESIRQAFLKSLRDRLKEELDPTGLDEEFSNLITDEERDELTSYVKVEVLPRASDVIKEYEYQFDPEYDDPDDYLSELDNRLESFNEIFHGHSDVEIYVDDAVEELTQASERIKDKAGEVPEAHWEDSDSILAPDSADNPNECGRSIFDDVDS